MGAANGVASRASASKGKAPLFSFGVIADVQYATSQTPAHSSACRATTATASPSSGEPSPGGTATTASASASTSATSSTGTAQKTSPCVRCARSSTSSPSSPAAARPTTCSATTASTTSRAASCCLGSRCRRPPAPTYRAYYDFSPCPQFRTVVLDAYDFSALCWPRDHPVTAAALRFLDEKNPNADKNSSDGLAGVDRRFVMYNGAVGEEQLSWLDRVLRDASARRQNVIVCSHLPMDPGAAFPESLMWNYAEVMAVVHRHGCVKACFAGHDHRGGHCVDSRGVHHRALEAALECPPGTSAFGHVQVYPDRLVLVGSDRMADTEMRF